MLRLWLPHRHLLLHRLHPNERSFSWTSRGAKSPIFLRHLYSPSLCLDRSRFQISAGSYESSISTFEKKSKGQKKREALRSVDWAAEFARFSDSQVRRAIRWGNLKEEVFEAVRIVKKIGRDGRHARTRQLKLIGSMLREVDPELMETIIKAIKDGDVEGVFNKSGDNKDEEAEGDIDDDGDDEEDDDVDDLDVDEDEEDEEESSSSEDEFDSMEHDNIVVERWLQGLLSGDSDVIAEVYSMKSADFNRQELRRLVRDTLRRENRALASSTEDNTQAVSERPASATKVSDPRANLREYLEFLITKKSKF